MRRASLIPRASNLYHSEEEKIMANSRKGTASIRRSHPGSRKANATVDKKDQHYKLYNKPYYEVEFIEVKCPICKNRIDEQGFCGCGAGDS